MFQQSLGCHSTVVTVLPTLDQHGSSYCRHNLTTIYIVPIRLRNSFAQLTIFTILSLWYATKYESPTSFHVRCLTIARCDKALILLFPFLFKVSSFLTGLSSLLGPSGFWCLALPVGVCSLECNNNNGNNNNKMNYQKICR